MALVGGSRGLKLARIFGAKTMTLDFQSQNLRGRRFTGQAFAKGDFRNADIRGVDFSATDLSGADLQDADLSRAKLAQAQLYNARLNHTCLTGAYIQDWGISLDTQFEDVRCGYIYMHLPTPDDPDPCRKPDNRDETFEAGDFADFICRAVGDDEAGARMR